MPISRRLLLPAALVLVLLGALIGAHFATSRASIVYDAAPIGLGTAPAPDSPKGPAPVLGADISISLPPEFMIADPNHLPIARGKTDSFNGRIYPYWYTYDSHPFYIINDSQAYDPNFVGNHWPRLVPRADKYMAFYDNTFVWRVQENNGSLSTHFGVDINAYRTVNSYYTTTWVVWDGAFAAAQDCTVEAIPAGTGEAAVAAGAAGAGAISAAAAGAAVSGVILSWCGAAGAVFTFLTTSLPTPGPTSAPGPGPTPLPGPTAAPTIPPMAAPTALPTPVPTGRPTPLPTAQPTPTPVPPTPTPTPVPPPPPTPVPADRLCCNSYMSSGAALTSQNGKFSLVMQSDGNLVLYNNIDGIGACWQAPGTHGHSKAVLTMQTDGNLVVYSSQGLPRTAIWASNSGGHGQQNYYVIVQNDGNLVIYSQNGASPLWATGTNGPRSGGGCQ